MTSIAYPLAQPQNKEPQNIASEVSLMKRVLFLGGAIPCISLIWAQPIPAPTVDRVGFPTGYTTTFTKLLTVDRPDNGQIRVVWGNAQAAATPWWAGYPYGSVLLFESWTSKRDSAGNLLFDENGRLIPDTLGTLFVKRKEQGFGEAYTTTRNGEWEYVAYRPDGTVQTAPQNSGACAACHLQGGPTRDWTFRRQQFGASGGGAIPKVVMNQYAFIPGDITVKKGTTVIWRNDDDIEHHIWVPELAVNSDTLYHSATYSARFDDAGEYTVRCLVHAGMRAKVTVTE